MADAATHTKSMWQKGAVAFLCLGLVGLTLWAWMLQYWLHEARQDLLQQQEIQAQHHASLQTAFKQHITAWEAEVQALQAMHLRVKEQIEQVQKTPATSSASESQTGSAASYYWTLFQAARMAQKAGQNPLPWLKHLQSLLPQKERALHVALQRSIETLSVQPNAPKQLWKTKRKALQNAKITTPKSLASEPAQANEVPAAAEPAEGFLAWISRWITVQKVEEHTEEQKQIRTAPRAQSAASAKDYCAEISADRAFCTRWEESLRAHAALQHLGAQLAKKLLDPSASPVAPGPSADAMAPSKEALP